MVKPRYQREKVQRSKVEHRRHGGKRPLPEPDEEEAQPASLSPASVPTTSLERRHFPRQRQQQQQIVLGRGGAGVDCDEYWPAPAPAQYHVQTHQQQGAYYSTMAYYDVGAGADSSATSSHQRPGHLGAAAVPPAPAGSHRQATPEAGTGTGTAAAATAGQTVEVQGGTNLYDPIHENMHVYNLSEHRKILFRNIYLYM